MEQGTAISVSLRREGFSASRKPSDLVMYAVSVFRRTMRSVFNGQNGRRLQRPTTLLLRDHCRQPRALPRSWPMPWSCTPRRATARRCPGSTVAPGQSEIGRSTIRAVSRPAASSFKKATSMPEREYAICRDYCSSVNQPRGPGRRRGRQLSSGSWNRTWNESAVVLILAEPHPWYCRTFKPPFQSVTYSSPSVVT